MEHILGFDQNLARMSTFKNKLMQCHGSHGSSLKLNQILANLLILYTETPSVEFYIWHFACFLTILWWECQNISKTLSISLFRINVTHFVKKFYESCIKLMIGLVHTIFISTFIPFIWHITCILTIL